MSFWRLRHHKKVLLKLRRFSQSALLERNHLYEFRFTIRQDEIYCLLWLCWPTIDWARSIEQLNNSWVLVIIKEWRTLFFLSTVTGKDLSMIKLALIMLESNFFLKVLLKYLSSWLKSGVCRAHLNNFVVNWRWRKFFAASLKRDNFEIPGWFSTDCFWSRKFFQFMLQTVFWGLLRRFSG